MNDTAAKPDRLLIIIASVIVLLALLALAAVFFRSAPKALDAATPAGVVQRYSIAVIDGDTAAAESFLSEAARKDCKAYIDGLPPDRVVLISTTERHVTAVVRVSIVRTSLDNGPFGPAEYAAEDTFHLVKVGDTWMLDQAPRMLLSCTGNGAQP